MTVKLARKKPVVVEFEIWSGVNYSKIKSLVGTFALLDDNKLIIRTLEGDMHASIGDYIIKGVNGEFYPCKPDIFEKTYDIVGKTSTKHVFDPSIVDPDILSEGILMIEYMNNEILKLTEKYSIEDITKAFEEL